MSSDTNGKKTTGMGGDLQLFWQEKVKKFFAGDKKVRVIAVLGIARDFVDFTLGIFAGRKKSGI